MYDTEGLDNVLLCIPPTAAYLMTSRTKFSPISPVCL